MTRTTLHATARELGMIGFLNRMILWLIALGILALIIAQFLPLIQKNIRMQRDLQIIQEEVRQLEWERYRNHIRIGALQHEPRAIEREIRERHGYARPDEKVVTFRSYSAGGGLATPLE